MNLFTNKRREEDRATITELTAANCLLQGDLKIAQDGLESAIKAAVQYREVVKRLTVERDDLANSHCRMAAQLEARRAKDPVRGADGRFVRVAS